MQAYKYTENNQQITFIDTAKGFFTNLWSNTIYFDDQGRSINFQTYFNRKFKDESEIILQNNNVLLKQIKDKWLESRNVTSEPYKPQFFLTEQIMGGLCPASPDFRQPSLQLNQQKQ